MTNLHLQGAAVVAAKLQLEGFVPAAFVQPIAAAAHQSERQSPRAHQPVGGGEARIGKHQSVFLIEQQCRHGKGVAQTRLQQLQIEVVEQPVGLGQRNRSPAPA